MSHSLSQELIFPHIFGQFLDSGVENRDDDISESLLRALTHVKGDLVLVFCNTLLWGAVPFALGLILNKKRHGRWLVWLELLSFAGLKTIFDDRFLIHQYPQAIFHTFEWGYVLMAWLIVYSITAFFITKGFEFMNKSNQ